MNILNTIDFIFRHPLGSQKKIRSLIRYFNWQIRSRLSSTYHVMSWVNSSRLLVKHGDAGLTGNLYVGLHEFQDMGFLLHYLRSDDVFIDVGANAGSFTVLASKVVGSETISIEPIPQTFKRLEANIDINQIGNKVSALNMGLSSKKGVLRFTTNLDCMNHVVLDSTKTMESIDSISIKVDTLDSITADKEISLIKIDVEGYELPVLYGAKKVLNSKSLNAVIMEVNSSSSLYGHQYIELIKMLKKYSFECFRYNPLNRTLLKINKSSELNGNVIFIKNLDLVKRKINGSVKFNVNGIIF